MGGFNAPASLDPMEKSRPEGYSPGSIMAVHSEAELKQMLDDHADAVSVKLNASLANTAGL